MKRIAFIVGLLIGSAQLSTAQVSVSVNIPVQPLWGPVGYDYVDYYYLPDIETYYYVPRRQYIYLNGGQWVFTTALPSRYRGYDLFSGYKVVINEPKPYLKFANHKVTYAKFKGNKGKQMVIKNSKEAKYHVVKGHPSHAKVKANPGKGGGKAKGEHKH